MSALKAKSAVKSKFAGDSDDESEIVEEQNPEEDYEEDSDTEDEDLENPEDMDNDPEEEYDEYDLDIAANIDLARDDEPADIGIMSEPDDEESMLISKDSLNIHTSPYLTKYELTKVLALRAQQILTSAPPTVPASAFPDNTYPVDPYTIALMELKMSRLPLIIGRRLPNNTIIRIPVHALLIPE
jgi:DNA-directed RNA polymerase subunit K/omega